MLLRQERLALGLLCAVTVVIILTSVVLNSIDRTNFAEPYHDKIPDGALTEIVGEIGELSGTRTGGHLIARVDGIPIFIPSDTAEKVSLRNGDRVRIIGVVQTYRGEKEIIVQSPADIMLQTTVDVSVHETVTGS
jgi:hypothetical protein